MMRVLIQALLLAAVLMPVGLRSASAQVGEVLVELLIHCREDAADFCRDVEPGGGRVAACLYSRLNDLSPRCNRAMRDGIALRACGSDVARYCRDIEPGEGRIAFCLRDYREDLSPRCLDALASARSLHRRDYSSDYHSPRYEAPYDRKGRARPEYGEDGQNGQDGEDGDSIK